jgi:hypothetical protein
VRRITSASTTTATLRQWIDKCLPPVNKQAHMMGKDDRPLVPVTIIVPDLNNLMTPKGTRTGISTTERRTGYGQVAPYFKGLCTYRLDSFPQGLLVSNTANVHRGSKMVWYLYWKMIGDPNGSWFYRSVAVLCPHEETQRLQNRPSPDYMILPMELVRIGWSVSSMRFVISRSAGRLPPS